MEFGPGDIALNLDGALKPELTVSGFDSCQTFYFSLPSVIIKGSPRSIIQFDMNARYHSIIIFMKKKKEKASTRLTEI